MPTSPAVAPVTAVRQFEFERSSLQNRIGPTTTSAHEM